MKKHLSSIGLIILAVFLLTACQSPKNLPAIPQVNRIPVISQTLSQSRSIRHSLTFPGLITTQQQAKILAKASGNAEQVFFKLGDQVKAGDLLLKMDDVTGRSYGTDFNSGAINQAKIASEQAAVAYKTAQLNYQNLLASTQKDLLQTDIALSQAETFKNNTQDILSDNLKSAQIAYETAKLATSQAKLSLDNKLVSADQSRQDSHKNAELASITALNASNTIITGINLMTAFDESQVISIPYKNYLGALNSVALNDAKNLYKQTKKYYEDFLEEDFPTPHQKLTRTILLVHQVKSLVDGVKSVFDNTIVGALLPQASGTGQSLSGLQSVIAGYQTQINTVLSQLQSADQALNTIELGNQSALDGLQKAYDIAQQQEKAAAQNLSNLQNTSKNQLDQVNFNKDQAANNYENTKIKLNSQHASAKAQLDNAQLQYQNALIALNSLTNNYQLVSPIDGVITQNLISEGETISPGQLLMTISDLKKLKILFYVDQETLPFLSIGLPITFNDDNEAVFSGSVTAISSTADPVTKRFLVEAEPHKTTFKITPGTITTVSLTTTIRPSGSTNILLPLSAITISQNGSSIFIDQNDRAKEVPVKIGQITGEIAEVSVLLPENTLIVVEGNKLLHEGDYLTNAE